MDQENEQSLYDTISSAFEQSESDGSQQAENSTPSPQAKGDGSSFEDSENDKAIQQEVVQQDGSEENHELDGIQGSGEDQEEKVLNAPEHWPQADKDAFKSASKEVQEWALRRDKEMNADYTRKTTEIANFKKTWDPVQQMFAPHIERGVNPSAVIQQWASIAQQLEQNPAQTLQNLAQQYRVDLTSSGQNDNNSSDEIYRDPKISELEKTVMALSGHLQQRDQMEQQTKVQSFQNDIEAFAQQKTEAGDSAHPYFDDLMPQMINLARASWQAGVQPKLQDLYEQALWANPETRAKTLDAQQKAAAKKAEQEAIAKAKKAKQAGKSIGGSGSNNKAPSDLSIRENLESLFDSYN